MKIENAEKFLSLHDNGDGKSQFEKRLAALNNSAERQSERSRKLGVLNRATADEYQYAT